MKMQGSSIGDLLLLLLILVLVSAFFSGSEIGMMSFNRYRLNHLVRNKHKKALRVKRLLEKPDRLLGVILIGNTLANIVASAVATMLGQQLYGDTGVAIATGLLTFVILIFAEMMPKTLAAIYPEKIAFSVSFILHWAMVLLSPIISMASILSNGVLRLIGIKVASEQIQSKLTDEEFKSVVNEAGAFVSSQHKSMFLRLIDLEKVTVDDIMVPRNEIVGIDLSSSWDEIMQQLETAQHTRLVVYTEGIENIEGMIHLRSVLNLMADEQIGREDLVSLLEEPYYIFKGTGLYKQLILFQKEKKRSGLVVDEYGEIKGLVTLEDILEEVVGEFTTDMAAISRDVIFEEEGQYLIDASVTIRELNRATEFEFPQEGPKTLNGLITETLATIPPPGSCLKLHDVSCEVLQVKDNMVKTVRLKKLSNTYTRDPS